MKKPDLALAGTRQYFIYIYLHTGCTYTLNTSQGQTFTFQTCQIRVGS